MAERAVEARRKADKLACDAWNKRMLAFKGQRSTRLRWVTRLMQGTSIWRSAVSVAIPTRPSRSISCVDRRRRRSTNWNATCGARAARRCVTIRTSAAIWLRFGARRFRRVIRHRRFGRVKIDRQVNDQYRYKGGFDMPVATNPHKRDFFVYQFAVDGYPFYVGI